MYKKLFILLIMQSALGQEIETKKALNQMTDEEIAVWAKHDIYMPPAPVEPTEGKKRKMERPLELDIFTGEYIDNQRAHWYRHLFFRDNQEKYLLRCPHCIDMTKKTDHLENIESFKEHVEKTHPEISPEDRFKNWKCRACGSAAATTIGKSCSTRLESILYHLKETIPNRDKRFKLPPTYEDLYKKVVTARGDKVSEQALKFIEERNNTTARQGYVGRLHLKKKAKQDYNLETMAEICNSEKRLEGLFNAIDELNN